MNTILQLIKNADKPLDFAYNIFAKENLPIIHDGNGNVYCALKKETPNLVIKLESESFNSFIKNLYKSKMGVILRNNVLKELVSQIQAEVIVNSQPEPIYNRFAYKDDCYYYYLYDDMNSVVVINKDGYYLTNECKVYFKSDPLINKQNFQIDYSINIKETFKKLPNYIYLGNNESNLYMFITTLVTSYMYNLKHPILMINGEQGSAKTTLTKSLIDLLSPTDAQAATLAKDVKNLAPLLNSSYIVNFDNVVNITNEVSNLLCQAVTKGTYISRKLYTNDENSILNLNNFIIINGISINGLEPDLLDRSIKIDLKKMENGQRKTENQVQAKFKAYKNKLLNAVFATISKVLNNTNEVKFNYDFRMLDFATTAYKIIEVVGLDPKQFEDIIKTKLMNTKQILFQQVQY